MITWTKMFADLIDGADPGWLSRSSNIITLSCCLWYIAGCELILYEFKHCVWLIQASAILNHWKLLVHYFEAIVAIRGTFRWCVLGFARWSVGDWDLDCTDCKSVPKHLDMYRNITTSSVDATFIEKLNNFISCIRISGRNLCYL